MKLLAIVLALAVISGCHGGMLPMDDWELPVGVWENWEQPRSNWETTMDRLNEFFSDLTSQLERVVEDIQSSHFGRELDTLTQDSMAELALYRDNLRDRLAPYAQDSAEQLRRELWLAKEKLHHHVSNAGERVAQYGEELRTLLEERVGDIRAAMNTYGRKLRKRLTKDTELINKNVAAYVEDLQTRTADNVDNVRMQMEPYVNQVRENAEAKISTFNRLLTTQAEELKDKLQTSTDDVRQRLDKTAEMVRQALQEKLDELRAWFRY